MLVLAGDNPDYIESEAAVTNMCGVCPFRVSSGKTNRMCFNRGGNWQVKYNHLW